MCMKNRPESKPRLMTGAEATAGGQRLERCFGQNFAGGCGVSINYGIITSGICLAAGRRKAYTNAPRFTLTYIAGKLPEIVSTCCGSAT